jgi:hypothetical protein
MIQKDRELSRRLAEALGSQTHSAWLKAWQALQSDPNLGDGLYVEGWAVTLDGLLAMEHGWLELDGRIVDPTQWDGDVAYFPGLRFDKDQALKALQNNPELPIAGQGGARLWDNPAYYRAWQDANIFTRSQLAERRGPVRRSTTRLFAHTGRPWA